jgi:hypothetical protein
MEQKGSGRRGRRRPHPDSESGRVVPRNGSRPGLFEDAARQERSAGRRTRRARRPRSPSSCISAGQYEANKIQRCGRRGRRPQHARARMLPGTVHARAYSRMPHGKSVRRDAERGGRDGRALQTTAFRRGNLKVFSIYSLSFIISILILAAMAAGVRAKWARASS